MAQLAILLLGPPLILRDGVALELPRRRARALVFYLALQPAPVLREQLLDLLWPGHERTAAQQQLRSTLHAVRRLLGPSLVGDDALWIHDGVECDYRTLTRLIHEVNPPVSALTAALGRYRGELLAGFTLADAEPFEDWLGAERERVRLLMVRGWARLARMEATRHAYGQALVALDHALELDPLQEDLQREAMRLHYMAGDRVGAIRRYELLRRLLDVELGVPPMRETQALYDAVITDTLPVSDPLALRSAAVMVAEAPASRDTPLLLPFTGRVSELSQLDRALAAGKLALIEGEPGIGKTRLATELLARITARGGLTLVGVARELEQSLPYQPVISALRGLVERPDWSLLQQELALDPIWLREVARLLPELVGSAESGLPSDRVEEARLWEGVTRLLLALTRRGPLAMLLDDAHWADASSLGLLGYLLRRAEGRPLMLMVTARPFEARTTLGTVAMALTREGRLERLRVRRLEPADSEALARSLCPDAFEPLAEWLQRHAEGNPYILAELISYAREHGLIDGRGRLQPGTSSGPVVPHTVYSLIESRLARLSERARRVLDAAVAAGRAFEFEVVARAAALSEAAALDALDELCSARLIETLPDGRYSFDHSLTMEVAYREVGEPRHRALHRRVAEALEALYRDRIDLVAGLIASHWSEGGAPERAAIYALRAGRRAAAIAAWTEAIGFYEQALVGVTGRQQRFELLLTLGDALLQHGEAVRATERGREALALARDTDEMARARLMLAGMLVPQARFAEVIALVSPLVATPSPAIRAQALFRWGTALSLEGADLREAALRLREAEALISELPDPDPVALAQVRFELGSVAAQQGDLPAAVAAYDEAMRVADAAEAQPDTEGALIWRVLARNNLAYHLHLLSDLETAAHYAAGGLALAEQRGAVGLLPYLYSTIGEIALARGDVAAAEAAFTSGLALAEQLVIPERIAGLTANLGLIALRYGQVSLAIHRLSAALARADALGTRHLAAQVRVWLAPLLPATEARATLAEARAVAEHGGRRRLLEEIARVAKVVDGL